jgi:hypothetical protein
MERERNRAGTGERAPSDKECEFRASVVFIGRHPHASRDTLNANRQIFCSALKIAPLRRGLFWCFGFNRLARQPNHHFNHDAEEKHVD